MTSNDLRILLAQIKVTLPNGRTLFSIPKLEIPFGSHILIQGESGQGKTTLLHLIAGLFNPNDGYVEIGDRRLGSLNDNELCEIRKKNIGVIFQKLNLIDHLTIEENISLSVLAKNKANDIIDNAVRRVNLEGRRQERCSNLSLGEQQRVAVARVLAQDPDIILADEPTSSLDEKNAGFVLQALKEIAKGKTLIVVSHDHRIAKYFDKVIPFQEYCK
jgi:ABC-type lipoprotein export system ATPase subunit